jgi:ribonucleoside-diphosphate reductase alpha chain
MQSAWQLWIDASISSTINLPNSATIEDVENIYMSAWKHGLKGVTVYRAGCARDPVLDSGNAIKESNDEVLPRGYVIPSEDLNLVGLKRKLITGCGSLHCMAYFDKDTHELRETYLSKGSTGGCNNFMIGLSRLISTSARGGISLDTIVDQLDSTGVCPSYATRRATKGDTSVGSCCPMAIGRALLDMQDEINSVDSYCVIRDIKEDFRNVNVSNDAKCPRCGEPLIHEGGCISCKSCGWNKCD